MLRATPENGPRRSSYQLYSKHFDVESTTQLHTLLRARGCKQDKKTCPQEFSRTACGRAKPPTAFLPYRSRSNTKAFKVDPLETSEFPFHYKWTWEIKRSLLSLLSPL